MHMAIEYKEGGQAVDGASTFEHNRLLSKARTSEFLGISERHLDRLSASGVVPPPITIGRRKYWKFGGLVDWTNSHSGSASGKKK
ncbi:hypothetical protein [Methylocella sp. CPCC 101449]|uniref:helix-turn-helix transcriptional regulator n=1 Tax=Methylocella sp. CPCC 101449 TaxID=2987531 RepID=UPI002891798D|nr:hypothetical protein [Methylocella sp. CPCC 101449]MDT2024560.1 hypothetical protein [Methylocella sp. CPCC 101449]